uniref:RNA polymerase sigma-70 factor n=1 Tax=Pedobacter schmidteae TaxID=2201271 RepID=UPI000EAB7C57|nr:RNA polymerase sigma-70 factor [Pedobacter schmidteae]
MAAYTTYTDGQLLDFLKGGDRLAFTEIFDRYNALLFSHADRKLQDEEDARDVVQNVFVKLWEKQTEIQINTNLSGYLYTAVRNQIFNLIKHRKVISTYADGFYAAGAEISVFADDLLREKEFAAMIEREINALPPRMREVFELRRIENLSNKEVGLRLGITELTAADQMKKAMRILKTRIGLILVIAIMMDK